ncbi:hypothetical protein [Laceyella sacchari]|uniref:Uncharacterized protein n=1 Tax=Laceyella sacchari TaxID=37482 RepID=A0ABY5U0H9_LACSH|nr:hypothetical protein [Laceyella sacchari]UWE03129.1 hypothetical protein NYR52_13570 [Laceyella sacchari]
MKQLPHPLFVMQTFGFVEDRASRVPLAEQLARQVVAASRSSQLPAGSELPMVRAWERRLQVCGEMVHLSSPARVPGCFPRLVFPPRQRKRAPTC